jgi:hypothetical protein
MAALQHVLRTATEKRVAPLKLGAALKGLATADGPLYAAVLQVRPSPGAH